MKLENRIEFNGTTGGWLRAAEVEEHVRLVKREIKQL